MNKILVLLALVSPMCFAEWRLNGGESHLSFISIKNGLIAEVHRFESLHGGVNGEGQASVNIGLASLETNIPIRNDRMKSMLFDTDRYALATATGQLDLSQYTDLEPGQSVVTNVDFLIDLHGIVQSMSATVKVTRTGNATWHVVSIRPLVLNATAYNLTEGIEALRAIAGLTEITPVVPVTFSLQFSKI
ncbi:MAG TPA: hypothetical protein DCM54_11415 [Gammaproteobacteria bacterium]|nr:hypothetical protein [Gammaproteobacteria bacterium]